jgi:hypothetical protein
MQMHTGNVLVFENTVVMVPKMSSPVMLNHTVVDHPAPDPAIIFVACGRL